MAAVGFFATVYGISLIVEIFYGMMKEMDVEHADYILLLSIIHFLDIISYKIFNIDYFVIVFGEPTEIEYSFTLVVGLYVLLFSSFTFLVNYIISKMEVTK